MAVESQKTLSVSEELQKSLEVAKHNLVDLESKAVKVFQMTSSIEKSPAPPYVVSALQEAIATVTEKTPMSSNMHTFLNMDVTKSKFAELRAKSDASESQANNENDTNQSRSVKR